LDESHCCLKDKGGWSAYRIATSPSANVLMLDGGSAISQEAG